MTGRKFSSSSRLVRLLLASALAWMSGCGDGSDDSESAVPPQSDSAYSRFMSRRIAPPDDSPESNPMRPLLAAAELGRLDELQRLLAETQQTIDDADPFDFTLLHAAAEGGQLACLEWLLENGANPNALSATDQTPILFAIENHHDDCAIRLIEAGAEVNVRSETGWTPLTLAVRFSQPAMPDVVAALLEAGADVQAVGNETRFGNTVLMLASPQAPEVIEMLLKAGADPNQPDQRGETAIQHARREAERWESRPLGAQEADAWRTKIRLMQDWLDSHAEKTE